MKIKAKKTKAKNLGDFLYEVKIADLIKIFDMEEIAEIVEPSPFFSTKTILLSKHEMKQLTELWNKKKHLKKLFPWP